MRTVRQVVRQANHSRPMIRPLRAFDSWWLDVKLGARMLIKYPGLALVGSFGIAVAVAIAAGAFSVIYGSFLVSSLPLEEGDRIVSLEIWDSVASHPERRALHDYYVWREELQSVHQISAFRTLTPNLIAPGAKPESVRVASMSASGFRVARVQPLLGRYLVEDDERDGAPPVVVIGENVWRNRFAADTAIQGRTIQLGTTSYSIVGVMPESFAFPVNHAFWAPLRGGFVRPEPLSGPDLMVFGRLAPGATLESAQAELAAIGRRATVASPKIYAHLRPQVMPYPYTFVGLHETQDVTGILMMNLIITMLLVLVCLNVAILVYTRTAMRQAEISVRTALGASRGRIVAQLFIEALVLSAVGAAGGVAIAALALRQVAAATLHIASELPFWVSFQLSPQSILYAAALTVLAAAIVGIVPALKATRRGVQTGLRVIGAGGSGMRLGKTWTTLVIAQVGFAVALMPAAIFNAWENLSAEMADPGFAAEEFLTARLAMDSVQGANATAAGTQDFTRRYADRQAELMRRLEADSQISSVTFAMAVPGDEPGARIETEDVAGISKTATPQTATPQPAAPQAAAPQIEAPQTATPQAITPQAQSPHPVTSQTATSQTATPQAVTAQTATAQSGTEPHASTVSSAGVSSASAPSELIRSEGTSGHEVRFNRVDVNFFRAFDVPILAGRGFEPADVAAADAGPAKPAAEAGALVVNPARAEALNQSEAVVVNQSFAQRIFSGDALGRRIRYIGGGNTGSGSGGTSNGAPPPNEEPSQWYEIVGIVRDFPAGVSPGMLDSPLKLYHAVAPGQVQPVNLALRMRGEPSAFAQRLPEIAAAVDPDLQLRNILTMDEALRKEQWVRRLEAAVLGAVSLSVLLLSSAGIYALMSFTVSLRRKEIGIRMALGADSKRIVASIFSRALGQLAVGAALGMATGAALERASGGNLMRGNAKIVLPLVALFMMAVGFLAALGPARRGLRIEPTEALREQ